MQRGSPNTCRSHEAYEIFCFLDTTKVDNSNIVGMVQKEQKVPHTKQKQQQQKERKQECRNYGGGGEVVKFIFVFIWPLKVEPYKLGMRLITADSTLFTSVNRLLQYVDFFTGSEGNKTNRWVRHWEKASK